MPKIKQCPVCNLNLPEPMPDFCLRCAQELRGDLSLVPSLDLPKEALAAYDQRIEVARRVWKERQEMTARLSQIEAMQRDMLAALEKTQSEKQALERMQKTPAPKPEPPKPAAPKGGGACSEKTPVPDMKRDAFETLQEFTERINRHPPVPAGKGELIKERYDIATGRFPLKLNWAKWVSELAGGLPDSGHITADRDAARAIYGASPAHGLYARVKAHGEAAVIDGIVLSDGAWSLPVTFAKATGNGGLEWTEPVTGMVLIRVPGGAFDMGDTFGDGSSDEKPVHRMALDDFYIGKFPVTQGQWKKVMGDNPSHFKSGDDRPVEMVSWNDAQNFLKKLAKMNQGPFTFRLPSEAQWEYAARSGGKKERYAGGDDVDAVAWYGGNSGGQTHPVGKKAPNGLGIYDMSGNVWEWCEDLWDSGAYAKHANKNPIYTSGGGYRVCRGGCWNNDAVDARCAYRGYYVPAGRGGDLGFRVARIL